MYKPRGLIATQLTIQKEKKKECLKSFVQEKDASRVFVEKKGHHSAERPWHHLRG